MPAPRQSSIRVVAFASLIGTTIEWYDYFLYGTAAALVFNRLFFPTFDPLSGTLISLATYSVGFIARPVGGIVIGHYGDKIGRRPTRSDSAPKAGMVKVSIAAPISTPLSMSCLFMPSDCVA